MTAALMFFEIIEQLGPFDAGRLWVFLEDMDGVVAISNSQE